MSECDTYRRIRHLRLEGDDYYRIDARKNNMKWFKLREKNPHAHHWKAKRGKR